ncbi:MAG: biopolymer transporter ExbD [bacterium]
MRRLVQTDPEKVTINVTPIIDVALVLVIILMITAPMLAVPPLGLELPQARSRALGNEKHINVTLAKDGRVAIDEQVVPRTAFRRELSERFANKKDDERFLVVRADAGSPYSEVRELLQDARGAGATRIAIATRPPNGAVR